MTALRRTTICSTLIVCFLSIGCRPISKNQSGLKADAIPSNYKTNILQSGTVENSVEACMKAEADAEKKNRINSIFQNLATTLFGYVSIPGPSIVGDIANGIVSHGVSVVLPDNYSGNCAINDIRIEALSQEITNIYNSLKTEISTLKGSVGSYVGYFLAADLAAQNRGLLELTYNTDYEYKLESKNAGRKVKKKAAPGGNGKGGNSEDQVLIPIDGDTNWVRVFRYESSQYLDETIGAGEKTLASLKSGYSLMDNVTKPGSRDFFEMLKLLATITLPGVGTVDMNSQLLTLAYDVQKEGSYTDDQVSAPEIKTLFEDSTKEVYTMISLVRELVRNNPGVEIKFGPNLPKLQIKEKKIYSGYEWVDLSSSGIAKGAPHSATPDEQLRIKSDDNGLDYTITVFGKEEGAKILKGKLILNGQEWGVPVPKSAGTVTKSNGNEYIAYKSGYFDSAEFKKLFFDGLEKKVINGDFPDPSATSLRANFLSTRAIYDTLNICYLESMQRQMEKRCEELKADLNRCKGISEAVTPTLTPISKGCEAATTPNQKPAESKSQY